jgi:NADH:ubiquinone oxidoreductase subunit 5 (subunit L)/multisubunit Na+/H+ antiporter MnhA subunit
VTLILIAALPFLGALLPGLMIRSGRNACAWTTALVTLTALIGLLVHAPAVMRGEVIQYQLEWMPLLGLNANFFLDGLGLLFAGLILGHRVADHPLCPVLPVAPTDPMGQFYTYLLLFQGAMVGIVLSDNILLLLIFWELTSLSSFLLIGYWKHLPEGRQGARMALAVTGMGGLALIGGMLILGNIVGSYDLTVILTEQGTDSGQPALPARADPDPAGLLYQIGAVSVPFLAAPRDGRPHAGIGLSAFGHDGEGGAVPDGAAVAGAGWHAGMVLYRRHRWPDHHDAGCGDRAVQG